MTKPDVFPEHRWRSSTGLVHHIVRRDDEILGRMWAYGRMMAWVGSGEARTACGLMLASSFFDATHDPPTCFHCALDVFNTWRWTE